jgi:hypothetical protein
LLYCLFSIFIIYSSFHVCNSLLTKILFYNEEKFRFFQIIFFLINFLFLIAIFLNFLFSLLAYISTASRQQSLNEKIIIIVFYLSGITIYFSYQGDYLLEEEIMNKSKLISIGGFLFSAVTLFINQVYKGISIASRLEANSEYSELTDRIHLSQKIYLFLKTIKEADY